MRQAGLRPNRLTNSWVPFLVASTLLLKPGGRLAMVIPAELLQVNYAAELRYFISEQYHEVTLITFKRLVFEDVQQEVVLFLGERGPVGEARIRTAQLDGIEDLDAYRHTTFADGELKSLNHSAEKWTQYFLEAKEIALLRELRAHPGLARLGDYADVDVGIVTGLNEFFVLSERQVRELSLQPYTRRIVSRSGHLRGVVFSDTDWRENLEKQLPAYLLDLPNLPFDELPEAARDYVASGEGRGIHQGYKCRIRKRWYIVPSVWTPNAFMLRQVHAYPKIILNEAAATCTDTIHRIRLKNGRAGETLAAAFFNSLTFAFAEVMGRSYGGGVLELEPNEADELPLPLRGADRLNLGDLNRLVLAGDIDPALDLTDKTLLIDNLGLTRKQTSLLRGIWGRLRDRRVNRR